MALRYFPASALTGDLQPMELPLHDVRFGGGARGGFSAKLDLRRLVEERDWAMARQVRDLLAPGVATIAVVIDDMWAGDHQPTQAHVHGEWLIEDVARDFADPVISISGIPISDYPLHRVIRRTWTAKNADPMVLVRDLLAECYGTGQSIALTLGTWASTDRRDVDWPEGSITYADAIRDLCADRFEWAIHSRPLGYEGGIPPRAERHVLMGAPTIRLPRPDITLEAVTPGSTPAGVLTLGDNDPLSARADELYAFGAGAGADQVVGHDWRGVPTGYVRLSRMMQARSAETRDDAFRQARAALTEMTPAAHTITALVDPAFLPGEGPQVGHVYNWIKEPSLSIPTDEAFRVRVIAYEWTPGEGGRPDRVILTLAREAA